MKETNSKDKSTLLGLLGPHTGAKPGEGNQGRTSCGWGLANRAQPGTT